MKAKKRASFIKVDEDLFLALSWYHHSSPFSNERATHALFMWE
jgi:hypothetical protein